MFSLLLPRSSKGRGRGETLKIGILVLCFNLSHLHGVLRLFLMI